MRMTSPIPRFFTASVADFASYPENLVHKTTYLGALRSYKTRLDDIAKSLCVTKDVDANVPFRDLTNLGPGM